MAGFSVVHVQVQVGLLTGVFSVFLKLSTAEAEVCDVEFIGLNGYVGFIAIRAFLREERVICGVTFGSSVVSVSLSVSSSLASFSPALDFLSQILFESHSKCSAHNTQVKGEMNVGKL